jgi:hypothetical protein
MCGWKPAWVLVAPRKQETPSETGLGTTHGTLRQNVQTIRELRDVTLALADQLESTARVLSTQHDPETMLTIEVSWSVHVSRLQDSPLLPVDTARRELAQ